MNGLLALLEKNTRTILTLGVFSATLISCGSDQKTTDLRIKQLDTTKARQMAAAVDSLVKPEMAEGFTLSLWGGDSLVISPIAIDIDDQGRLYYTTTNRQKNSEFDIRGHRDWEIESIRLQTIDDKREFLHRILAPENSRQNEWLKDLNGDSSHDWKDMTVEKENIYRLEDVNGDGVADKSQLVVDDFHDEVTDVAGGVLSEGDDLFVAVGPDMWRMKDRNGDGIADDKTSISTGYGIHIGFGGHGMSGVEMGPDGKIYWQIGDIGFNGKGPDGQKWEHPNSGVVVRSNPDGSDFEVFAYGNRNTHEFVFDEYGNLISEDNDGDHAGEKERLVYIVNGADIGWRSNWQYGKYRDPKNNTYKVWMDEKMYLPRFEGQAAYITPCISNFVSGPAGMVYNPGTALSPEYRNCFFIAEFVGSPSNSAIHSFRLNPNGASFSLGETKKILSGVLPTGLDFGPDGAMYVADWIDGWDTHDYGRIWKLDHKNADQSQRKLTKELLTADFKKKSEQELGEILKNADMRVRLKAQFELVKRGTKGADVFKQMLAQKTNQLARIHSIWGLAQLGRQQKSNAAPIVGYLNDGDAEIRAQSAKWLGDIRYAEAATALITLLKDTNSRARFFAAEALGRIKYASAVQPLIQFLKENNDADAYLRHAGALALARIGNAEALIALSSNPSKAVRIAATVALRRMGHAGIASFLNDADEFIVTEAARGINDDLSIKDALPALANLIKTTKFSNEALMRRVINANLRVGNDECLQNLINYSLKADAPGKMRAEAMDALAGWASPSVLDRVDGRYRGVIERDAHSLATKTTDPFIQLLKDKDLSVRISAAKAIHLLKIKQASASLFAQLKNDQDPAARVECLKALVALNDQQLPQAIQQALTDKEKQVRVAGLDLMSNSTMPKDLMAKLLNDVIAQRTVEEKQAALLTLGKLPADQSKSYLSDLLAKMETGRLPADIYLELGEALDSAGASDLVARYKAATAKLGTTELAASYASALMGGDANRGKGIFFRHQAAQCIRCHTYDDYGGNAGPRLNGIGKRLSREQILEAMIDPSKRISPGFGVATLTLKDGKLISGIVQAETNAELKVKIGDEVQTIAKDQITKRTNAPSSMPDMKPVLTKKEIRDIVSFLSESKEDK